MFPPSPRDWLPEGHLAFFVADTVAALDLGAFYAPTTGMAAATSRSTRR